MARRISLRLNPRCSGFAPTVIALAAVLLAAPPLPAQLQDSDLRLIVPMLEAEIAAAEQRLQQRLGIYAGPRLRDEIWSDTALLNRGELDVLAWIRARSREVPIPPGARYVPGCSRAWSRVLLGAHRPTAGLEHLSRPTMTAVFTMDVSTGGAFHLLIRTDQAGGAVPSDSALRAADLRDPSDEGQRAIRRVVEYYRRVGFLIDSDQWPHPVVIESNDYSHTPLKITMPRNSGAQVLGAKNWHLSMAMNPEDARECRELPTGPVLLIELQGLPGEVPESHTHAAFYRIGFRDRNHQTELYNGASHARWLIRNEADRAGDGSGPTPEERRDVTWYRRHAATLDPLFDELDGILAQHGRADGRY